MTAFDNIIDGNRAYDYCERAVRALTNLTGIKWTFGYIGNLDAYGRHDDREWFAFAEHPGRVGNANDRIGGFPTGQLDRLAEQLRGAVQMAQVMKVRGR